MSEARALSRASGKAIAINGLVNARLLARLHGSCSSARMHRSLAISKLRSPGIFPGRHVSRHMRLHRHKCRNNDD